MRVLVADDHAYNRELLSIILEDEGHQVVEAVNGIQAVDIYCTDLSIDIVLMDINMPEMDGISATKLIKTHSVERFVPIIFITALDNAEIIASCLDAGGDDFVPKPVNEDVLIAKLNAHARTLELYNNLHDAHAELSRYKDIVDREHAIVEHIFLNYGKRDQSQCQNVRQHTSPASMFDGDVVLVSSSLDGGVYILVGDFAGHGLVAAIGALPLSEVFYSMVSVQASIAEIASALNQRLLEILPADMCCCATIMYVDASGRDVTVWSGGMHDILAIKPNRLAVEKFPAKHGPLGVLSKAEFDSSLLLFQIEVGEKVYIHTEGIVNTLNSEQQPFGLTRLEDQLLTDSDDAVASLNAALIEFHGGAQQADDISIVELVGGPLQHLNIPESKF